MEFSVIAFKKLHLAGWAAIIMVVAVLYHYGTDQLPASMAAPYAVIFTLLGAGAVWLAAYAREQEEERKQECSGST